MKAVLFEQNKDLSYSQVMMSGAMHFTPQFNVSVTTTATSGALTATPLGPVFEIGQIAWELLSEVTISDVASVTPIVGPVMDLSSNIREGEWGWAIANTGFLAADVFTLGTASVARGVGKIAVKKALTNNDLIFKVGNKAWNSVRNLSPGPQRGIKAHEYATNLLERYQSRYGNRGLLPKFSRESSVLDVYDVNRGIIYDWKFGSGARMSAEQLLKYQTTFNPNNIFVLKYVR